MQLINGIAILTGPEAHVVQSINCGEYIAGSAETLLQAMDQALGRMSDATGMELVKMRLGETVRNRLANLLGQPSAGGPTPVLH